ncbi:MAG: flavodoxin family protein [Firmicutes bacterium]|nr:flavodoxin family protein [Bacillota bacterium]
MKIVVLNGSPRAEGNTAAHVEAFAKGASAKHDVCVLPVGTMNIGPCKACAACFKNGGKCVQEDDMEKVTAALKEADMVVFASPIYYHSISGQLQNVISRFFAIGKPSAAKYALFLSSGSDGVYDAAVWQYRKNVEYFKAEDMGVFCAYGALNKSEEFLKKMEDFGASL